MEVSFPLATYADFNVCSAMAKLYHSPISTIPQRTSYGFASPCNRHRFYCTFPFKDYQRISNHLTRRMHRKTSALRHVTAPEEEVGLAQAHCLTVVQNSEGEAELTSSSMAIAMAIRRASASPVEFVQRMEKVARGVFSSPSADFRTLCNEQLALCGNLVGEDILLSVYIRPAETYGTHQLELRRAALYPGQDLTEADDMLVLIGTFGTQTGLRSVETALVERPAEELPEHNALVLPLVKDLFLVGLLVAIRPPAKEVELSSLPAGMKRENDAYNALFSLFTAEKRSEAVKIAHSLALAYVMDQRALLLQKTSWQRGVKMSNLMEQIRSPLSNIRTLSKMLLPHLQRSEIPYDILEDILVQGEHMKDILQQLQDSFYYTKGNLMHYHEEDLSKVQQGHLSFSPMEIAPAKALDIFSNQGNVSSNYKDNGEVNETIYIGSKAVADLELPMPPLALAALQQPNIRPCNVSKLLSELVSAGYNLAQKQQQTLQLRDSTQLLQAAIEESALRQALSCLACDHLEFVFTLLSGADLPLSASVSSPADSSEHPATVVELWSMRWIWLGAGIRCFLFAVGENIHVWGKKKWREFGFLKALQFICASLDRKSKPYHESGPDLHRASDRNYQFKGHCEREKRYSPRSVGHHANR